MTEERQPVAGERDNRCRIHVHTFETLTAVADGHQHVIMGVTAPARQAGLSHVHRIRVRTSFVDDHWHWFDIMTGQAVALPNGGHVHYFSGETSFDAGHRHAVEGSTGLAHDEFDDDDDYCPNPHPKKR